MGKNKTNDFFPLLVIFSVIIIATMALEYRDRTWSWLEFGEHFMGLFLIFFSMFKLFDLHGFADAFKKYDFLSQRIQNYAVAYPFIELFLGCFYLSGILTLLTNLVTFGIMTVGLYGIVDTLRRGKDLPCACLGTTINVPLSTISILENGLMAAMAFGMLYVKILGLFS